MQAAKPLEAIVVFGESIPAHVQGPALFKFEQILRELAPGLMIEVFKEHMQDDSRLRSVMTPAQRARL